MLRCVLAIVLSVTLVLVASHRALAQEAQSWLVLSDLHFDPFTQPHLVDRLAAVPPNRWRAVLATGEATGPSGPGSDTNYVLLESTLDGARNAVSDPRVVVVSGDFLAHDFRSKFDRSAKDHGDPAYDAFVDKTIAFLAWEVQTAFPRAHLLPVIGNNDGYCGDYESTPSSPFLAHMAAAWAGSVGPGDATAFIAQFSSGGYYTEPLPTDGARAIVLNDVYWSPKYQNACGDAKADPGGDELHWLQTTAAAIPAGTPVWVIAHIPPGIDAFATTRAAAGSAPDPLLADRFTTGLISVLDSSVHVVMSLAGHTHMDSFRVIGPDPSSPRVPMLVVPSVSPIFGNAPSFTVLEVNPSSASVNDSQVYVLSKIKDAWTWHREYDFDSIYGPGSIDAAHLWGAQQTILDDEHVRKRFEEFYSGGNGTPQISETDWRAYWCANVALLAAQYEACAAPQILRELPPHPSAPPTQTPTASPSPAS
jgi:sphingomyelin phosphodiesterase acid-like 3